MKEVIFDEPHRVGAFVSKILQVPDMVASKAAIGLAEDNRLIAGVLFDQYNGASICMHVAARPGARWLTREYLWACFAYPFNQLKVKKVIGLVGERNFAAQRFDAHLGFTLETALKDAHPDGSLLIYSMRAQDCRWLNIRREAAHGKAICSAAS